MPRTIIHRGKPANFLMSHGVGTQCEHQPEGDALAGSAAIHRHLPRHGRPLLVGKVLGLLRVYFWYLADIVADAEHVRLRGRGRHPRSPF